MAEKVQDWKDWNGIKWEEGDFILAERMNLLQDNVQSLKDTIDIHNLLVENSDGTWNIAETRDVIMNVLTVAPTYDDLQFPVNEGDYCWHEGSLYCANTDIATAETWTAAHWDVKPVGDDVIAAYERIDEIQKSAEIQTLGSLEDRVGVLENNTVNKWESFPANTVIPEGTYCIYENKIYYAINDFTKTSSGDDSNPSSSHFCIEVANTTVRPKKIQIDDSAIEINRGISSSGQLTVTSFKEKTKKGGYGKVIHIDKTELYNHGKKIYITTTNHAGRFFAAALLNVNPATEGYSYTPTDSEEEIIVNVITNSADNVIVADCSNRELTSIKHRILDINNLDNEAQEKLVPAELTNNIYLLLYYGNSTTNPNELPREEILKDISIYYGVGTTQEQLDDLSARIDTTALEDSIEEIRNQIGTTETDKTLWQAIETNQNNISSNSQDIENNADEITVINNKIGTMEDTTPLVERINAKANQNVVNNLVVRVENLESTSSNLENNVSALTTTVQNIQTSIDKFGGKNLATNTFAGQFGENTDFHNIWELLKVKINSGDYSQIHVGDYVEINTPINNKSYSFKIYVAGINSYTGVCDLDGANEIKNHIDFVCDMLWPIPKKVGWTIRTNGSWFNTSLFSYLNNPTSSETDSPSNVFNSDDENSMICIKNYISTRTGYELKLTSSTSGSYSYSCSTQFYNTNNNYFWIPSLFELTGQSLSRIDFQVSSITNSSYNQLIWDCCDIQYPIFQTRKKFFKLPTTDTSVKFFPVRTMYYYDTMDIYPIVVRLYDLAPCKTIANERNLYFPICFRIEADS